MQTEQILGVEELAIAVSTPDKNGYNIVPILDGEIGHGKTATILSLFKNFSRCEVLSASLYDAADFSGYPVPSEDRSSVMHLPPSWGLFEPDEKSCLYLDDLTLTHPSVMNALMRLVLEKRIGNFLIPPSVKIVAASNSPAILDGAGHKLSRPLANRFFHVRFEMPVSSFISALEGTFPEIHLPKIDPGAHAAMLKVWELKFAAFLRRFPTMMSSLPQEQEDDEYPNAFTTPRSISMALRLCASAELMNIGPRSEGSRNVKASSVFLRLLRGSIGTVTAIAFASYLTQDATAAPSEVLLNDAKVDYRILKDDQIHLFFACLAGELMKLESDEVQFHIASLSMLENIQRLDEAKKIDTGYVSVRTLSQNGWLTKAAAAAHRLGELESFRKATQAAFRNDSQLAQFVEAIEGAPKDTKPTRKTRALIGV